MVLEVDSATGRSRRAYLTAVAGIGSAVAGCASVENPEGDGDAEALESEGGGDGARSPAVDVDEVLRWLPTDAERPRFRSEELAADGGSDDDRPSVDGVPVLATLEFTALEAEGSDGTSSPSMYFLEEAPTSDLEWPTDETDSYAVAIDPALDERLLVDTYEGAEERLTDVEADVEAAYEAVDLAYETVATVDPDVEEAAVTVASTDGEDGQLAVVFESEPTDLDLDAIREAEPTVDGIVGTGENLVVFEYAVPES